MIGFGGICVAICNMRFVFHIPHLISQNLKPVILCFFILTLGTFNFKYFRHLDNVQAFDYRR